MLQRAAHRLWWILAPALALLVYRKVSGFDFVADARFLILDNLTLRDLGSWWAQLTHDYFWSSSGNIIPYWRPVTKLCWLFEYRVFGAWAGGYLWVQVVFHVLSVLGVQALAREIGSSRFFALIAGLLMALHPVAIEPVALIMARSDAAAVAGGVWALFAWLRYRRCLEETGGLRSRRALGWLAAHVLLFTLALGSKEQALAWCGVFCAWSALAGDFRRTQRNRLWSLTPALVLSLVYWLVRRAVLEGVASGLEAVRLDLDPVRLIASLGMYLESSLPRLQSAVRDLPLAEAHSGAVLTRAVLVLSLFALCVCWLVRCGDRVALPLGAAAVLLLLPVLLTRDISVPQVTEKYPLADRWLYHALPAVSLLLARALERVLSVASQSSRRAFVRGAQPASALAAAVWAILLLARSAAATSEMGSELLMLDNEDRLFYQSVPAAFRTHDDDCRFEERKLVRGLLRNEPRLTLATAPAALARCADRPELKQDVLEALVQLELYADALPLARDLLRAPPFDRRGRARLTYLLGVVLYRAGEPARAEPLLAQAVELGQGDCRTLIALAECARANGAIERAADRLQLAFKCGGARDPSLLLAAATWLAGAGRIDRARSLVAESRHFELSADQRDQADRLSQAFGASR